MVCHPRRERLPLCGETVWIPGIKRGRRSVVWVPDIDKDTIFPAKVMDRLQTENEQIVNDEILFYLQRLGV